MRILKSHPLLKLVNSYLIDSSEPSNISYLWNFGVRRVRALFFKISPDFIAYSSVFLLCKLRVFTNCVANKCTVWVVEYKNFVRVGLPLLADKVSRCNYVEVNKLDTQRRHLFRRCILSRICRYIWGIAYSNIRNTLCWWEASRHPSIGKIKSVQAAKATRTLNGNHCQPRDLIAYDWDNLLIMRKRSFHSSSVVGTKGNSQNVKDNNEISLSTKNKEGKVKLNKSIAKPNLTQIRSSPIKWNLI